MTNDLMAVIHVDRIALCGQLSRWRSNGPWLGASVDIGGFREDDSIEELPSRRGPNAEESWR
jgi:hypothetical protein